MNLNRVSSIRIRFFTAFAVVALALWGAIAGALHSAERETMERASAEGRNLARSLAEHVASSIRAIDIVLLHLRSDWTDGSVPFADHVAREQKYLKLERAPQFTVIEADGRVAYSYAPGVGRVDLSDREWFKAHKAGNADALSISAPFLSRLSGQWVVLFTRAIYDRQRQFAGVLALSVPPPSLGRVYDDIDLGAGAAITLVRTDGQILAHSRDLATAASVSLADSPGLRADAEPAGEYRRHAKTDGLDRMYSYQKVPGYPLKLFVGQSVDTVLAPYREQRWAYLASGAFATALLLALTLLLIARRHNKDETDRQRARLEADLREGEERFRLIAESIDEVVWSADTVIEKNFYISPAYERVWGRPRDSLQANPRSFIEAIHPEDRERVLADFELKKTGRPFDHEYRIMLPDGSVRWIWDRGFPVRNEAGQVVRYVGAAQDITKRKQAEQLLRRNEEHLRVLFDSFPIAVAHVDQAQRITFANRIYRADYGSEPAGRTVREFVGEEIYAALDPHIKRALAGEEVQFERSFVADDGQIGVRSLRYIPDRDASGKVVGFFGLREDITERRRVEEKIRKLNEDLERRVRERTAELTVAIEALQTEVKERSVAEISALNLADRLQNMARRLGQAQEIERRRLASELHDGVCSNLAAIGLNLVLLQKQLSLTDVAGMERRLSGLIALIDEAKANAKDISVDLRPLLLDERDLLSALEEYARKFEGSTGISVEVSGADSGRRLPAEEKIALFRITQEALTNCAKHANAKAVAIELNTDSDHLVLSIADDGVGIDLSNGNGKSHGLGLLSMQERAESIGGEWRIDSAPGKGTRVMVKVDASALV
jgi:PAS domain S-box-containing protein